MLEDSEHEQILLSWQYVSWLSDIPVGQKVRLSGLCTNTTPLPGREIRAAACDLTGSWEDFILELPKSTISKCYTVMLHLNTAFLKKSSSLISENSRLWTVAW